ncbi:MAG: zinc ribbon domain-containing protein [Kiritimatiellae bacterium]|nr:zinc ribbon domain-containing protein [Kiritimatiellia bacterium]MDD5520936.1 zinc ribbon domain-containing protein [Kiritimatiellia bacterium]
MPTYEYECIKCKYLFEKFQSMKDESLKKCPKCRGKLRRLVGTGSGIIFKGSGFYETDYKRKGKSSGEPKTGKTDAKPAPSSTEPKSKSTTTKKE